MQESNNFQSFSHHFLAAMPSLQSDLFEGGLVYICEHTPEGATGVMINRPTDMTLNELLSKIEAEQQELIDEYYVYFGGPVNADRGFVLHDLSKVYKGSINNQHLALTSSKEILDDLLQGEGPDELIVCLGYAGWEAGQLEEELARNSWLTIPASTELVFKKPAHSRYRAALATLGISPELLTSQIGHA